MPRIPLGLGVDTVWISQFKTMLSPGFKQRAFTPAEREAREGPNCDVRLASCFAAKEAILKALGTGWSNGIAWTDIEVAYEPSGGPVVVLSGRAQEVATQQGVSHWLLSLSHDGDYAVATAIALGTSPDVSQATGSDSGNGE